MQFDELDEKRGGRKSSRDMVENVTGSIESLGCERFKMTKGFPISVLLETVLVEEVPKIVVTDGVAKSLNDATL